MGAGAGGLTAICKVLSGLPPGFDVAILIALDIGSQPAPIVLQILRSYSVLPVSYATNGALIRRGRVAVAPARHNMRIAQRGVIALEAQSLFAGGGPSVNGLFKTAALAYGERVIGVVLSGASHDGTEGLTQIEASGGVGIVQDPAGAFDASMPANAIRSDHPDHCCALERLAPLLIKLVSRDAPPGRFEVSGLY
ncbi:chemotaxis protein CheB [Variovorax sp. RB2P76]|uniref:chemotaxis protein CheB n=1 Tax=Variovorax sp. RB2P76 TaxID=3443736 RepID=UPI003F455130